MVNDLNSEYWNNRYLKKEFSWDVGEVSTPLKKYFDQLTSKEIIILIPGAGNAYEAEYLFDKGFKNVYVCEISEVAIRNFLERCKRFDPGHVLKSDFFELQNIKFDLVIEQTFFCALEPSLRQQYFEKMCEILKPGGKLIGLFFDDALNNDKPPFGGDKAEYLSYIKPPFKIKTFETAYNSIKPRAGRELFINLELGID